MFWSDSKVILNQERLPEKASIYKEAVMKFLQKDLGRRRAKRECLPLIEAEYKRLLHLHTYRGTNGQGSDHTAQQPQELFVRGSHDKSKPILICGTRGEPAILSLYAFQMECAAKISRSHPDWYEAIAPRQQSQVGLRLFGVRLYLLWLNILLVPTRIRCKLKCILKDPSWNLV